jgi:DNA-binding transcriptional LysR family regulator
MDSLEQWRIFTAVASRLSFSAAARSMGRSPQTITRAVATLEQRLGVRLMHRTTRSVSLTNEGERYLEQARRAVAEMDALELAASTSTPLTGRLSITAPVLFGQRHVVPVVLELLRNHPSLDLRLLLLDRVVSLAEEGIDVAVRIGALPDSALRARLVGHVRTVVCASPAYLERAGVPRSPDAIHRHTCISFIGTSPLSERWAFGRRSVAVRSRLIVNTGQAAIDAALAGLGLVRALSYQVDELIARGKLRVVLRTFEGEPLPVHLVQLPGLQARSVVAFSELAQERIVAMLDASWQRCSKRG